MERERKFYVSLLIILIAIFGVLVYFLVRMSSVSSNEFAKNLCIQLCLEERSKGRDLSNGPCLSDNNSKWIVRDWVCDVARWPRQDIDNLPENQCQEYREGKAHHFVEVSPQCEFIRAI